MEAHAKSVRAILLSGDQYLVPFFQRHYAWKKKHWERLLDDVVDLLEDGGTSQHFLGPLVFTPFTPSPGDITRFQLIDGQQRLTTLSLALAALRDLIPDLKHRSDITEDFLVHRSGEGDQRYKVVPRLEDRRAYQRIVDGEPMDANAGRVGEAYDFFKSQWILQLKAHGPERGRDILGALTKRLSLVTIVITGENPYEIFESLNSTGEPLEEADLIRNYLFMLVPLAEQDRFHARTWNPFESALNEATDGGATAFYRNYLMRSGAYVRKGSTFVTFKEHHRTSLLPPHARVCDLTASLQSYAWLLQPTAAATPALRTTLRRMDLLDVTTAYPLFLVLLEQFQAGRLSESNLLECLVDFSSFVLRRTVCGDSTRAYGRWFAEAAKRVVTNPVEDLKTYWLERGWPDDVTFSTRLQDFAIYKRERRKAQLMLETLEQTLSPKESVDLSKLQIEHILPQTIGDDSDGRAWQQSLGVNWKSIHERRLHTLPNLTLSGYNPELSNRAFSGKRTEYERSNLRLTREIAEVSDWNEEAMRRRGDQFAITAINLWPRPMGSSSYTPVSNLGLDEPDQLSLGREQASEGRYIVATLDWSEMGRALPKEIIAERVVAHTMAKFLGRLIAVLGDDAATKLANLRISRGPLLSTNPERDFRNPANGGLYGNRLVPGTRYHVLTHSGTSEKLGQMRLAADFLGVPAQVVTINLISELPDAI